MVRPESRICGGNPGVADGAGAGVAGATVLFEKFTQAFPSGTGMANGTTANGKRFSLVLDSLIVVRSFLRGDHGMRTAMASRAIHPAVARGIAVKGRPGIDLGDTGVTVAAFRLIFPRNPATVDT